MKQLTIHLERLTPAERRDLSNALLRAAWAAALEPTRILLLDLVVEADDVRSTLPALIRAPNSSSHSSTVSWRETRFLTASVATAACNREPNALVATSAGSSPVRSTPHSRQRARMHWCSITPTASPAAPRPDDGPAHLPRPRSPSANTYPHPHRRGQCSTTSSTTAVASSSRPLPS